MAEWVGRGVMFVALSVGLVAATPAAAQQQTVFPTADGTIVDGGAFGVFDGVPDAWDWYFNGSSYEGNLALTTSPPSSAVEYRLVWEYNLASVTIAPPVTATLQFTMRGPSIAPFPDTDVFVYSYPADLVEHQDDFFREPAVYQGHAVVSPFQAPTVFTIDVSGLVSEALTSGGDKVALRFQIDPATPNAASQAFIDATDQTPASKPFLVIEPGPPTPGDADGDGDVDVDDYAVLFGCLAGPTVPGGTGCEVFDFDEDTDVDLADVAGFQGAFTGS